MNQFQTWYRQQPPVLRALLTINAALYVATVLLGLWPAGMRFVWDHLALHPALPGILLEPWQLVTYSFLHLGSGLGGFLHILFNMLWLYWVGRELEELHGGHQLLALYLMGGVGGALLSVLLHPIAPFFVGDVIYGASGSVIAVLMGVALFYPYKKIALFLFGTFRLLNVLLVFLALDLLFFLFGSSVSVTAHWGGALVAWGFVRGEQRGLDLSSWARAFTDRSDSTSSSASGGGWMRRSSSTDGSARNKKGAWRQRSRAMDKEVDRILDKISEKGYDALSAEERETLERASQS